MTTWIDCDVRYAEHRARVARVERDGRLGAGWAPSAGHPAALATPALARRLRGARDVARLVAAALGRLAALAYDSRDGLRSKEQELAALGLRWPADPAADERLARELGAARLRPQVDAPATRSASSPAEPARRPGPRTVPPPAAAASHA